MMRFCFKILWLIFIVPWFVVSAQSPPAENGNDPENQDIPEAPPLPVYDVMLSFYVWPLKGILPEEFEVPPIPVGYLRDAETIHRVVLHRGALSPAVRYRSPEGPVLFRAEPVNRDGTASMTAVPLSRPDIPPEWRQAIILLYPEQQTAEGLWHAIPLHTATLAIPEGHSRILNSTSLGVVVQVEEHMTALPPGADVLLTPSNLGENNRVRLRIFARTPEGRSRMIYTNSLARTADQNQLLVIHSSMGGRPNVLSFSQKDLVPPPEPPDTP